MLCPAQVSFPVSSDVREEAAHFCRCPTRPRRPPPALTFRIVCIPFPLWARCSDRSSQATLPSDLWLSSANGRTRRRLSGDRRWSSGYFLPHSSYSGVPVRKRLPPTGLGEETRSPYLQPRPSDASAPPLISMPCRCLCKRSFSLNCLQNPISLCPAPPARTLTDNLPEGLPGRGGLALGNSG